MEAVFLSLVNRSITAGWLVLAVLVLRLLLRRAPKSILCAMWGLVGLRLLCPVSIESPLSLVPSAQPLPREILTAAQPEIYSGVAVIDRVVNPVLTNTLAAAPGESVNPAQVLAGVLPWIWLLGMVGMLGYALFTTLRLRRRVSTAVRLEQGVKQSEYVKTPFVLGLIHPTICPFTWKALMPSMSWRMNGRISAGVIPGGRCWALCCWPSIGSILSCGWPTSSCAGIWRLPVMRR